MLSTIATSPYRMLQARNEREVDPRSRGAELVTVDGRALPLLAATLRAEARGGIARVVLEQTFFNGHDETLHVTYKMPLPADGAVSGYAFEIAGRVVQGRVDPKAVARARFEEAIASGQTAALLEQQRDDIFTQEIGNIPARATIVARITVDQRLVWLPEGEWELRFPTVIGPRYVAAADDEAIAGPAAIEVGDAPLPVRMKLELVVRDAITAGRVVESPSHALATGEGGLVRLRAKDGARLDRDIVARWAVTKPTVGVTVAAARKGARTYALLTIVPPAPEARVAPVPRDLIVLLDTSGSMAGGPLDQAKRVVARVLDSLGERDRFEMIEFSSQPGRYRDEPLAGTPANKRDAVGWLKAREASGGTEMQTAVIEALRGLRPGAQRQVVLVTDGYIGGEARIVELCLERLPESCRLHVVGVGSAVNRSLAASLARAGRGCEVIVGLDEDVERGARRLLERTCTPILTDVTVTGGALLECAPGQMPDVFAGAPVVAALALRPEGGEIVVRGKLAHGEWQQRVAVSTAPAGQENDAVAALFARERVADLETRWSVGRDVAAIDRAIEAIGVEHQIATRMTSWIAVDRERAVDPHAPTRSESVPQELPYGTTMASFGLAPGAAEMELERGAAMGYGAPAEVVLEEVATLVRAAPPTALPRPAAAPAFRPSASVPAAPPPAAKAAEAPKGPAQTLAGPAPARHRADEKAKPAAPVSVSMATRAQELRAVSAAPKRRRAAWLGLLALVFLLLVAVLAFFFFSR